MGAAEEKALRTARLGFGAGGAYDELRQAGGEPTAYAQVRADHPALLTWADAEIATALRALRPTAFELLTQTPLGPFVFLSGLAMLRDGVDAWGLPPCQQYLAGCAALPGPVPFSTDNLQRLLELAS